MDLTLRRMSYSTGGIAKWKRIEFLLWVGKREKTVCSYLKYFSVQLRNKKQNNLQTCTHTTLLFLNQCNGSENFYNYQVLCGILMNLKNLFITDH